MLPSVDGPVPATIAGGALVAPAVESCGGALVIVAPIAGLEKGMPMVLGAYVSSDGSNWTGPNLLPSMSLCSNTSGALAGGPNGTLYCFYADSNKKVRYSVTSDGADWSDSGTIAGAFTSADAQRGPLAGRLSCRASRQVVTNGVLEQRDLRVKRGGITARPPAQTRDVDGAVP